VSRFLTAHDAQLGVIHVGSRWKMQGRKQIKIQTILKLNTTQRITYILYIDDIVTRI